MVKYSLMKKTDGIRDVLKSAKHRKPTQIYCPRCASPKIKLSSSLAVWLTPKEYYCENCGYRGIIVMELEVDEKEEET
jgi:C4-type Zn-finger protein